jgi:hypothetical protein
VAPFGTEPAKLRDGYANFAITEEPTRLDHLGVEVGTTAEVHTATGRLSEAGLATTEENDTTCSPSSRTAPVAPPRRTVPLSSKRPPRTGLLLILR